MTIRHYSPLFATIRHYSHYSYYSLFAIRHYSLFAIRDYSLFAVRYSLFAIRGYSLSAIRVFQTPLEESEKSCFSIAKFARYDLL